MMYVFGAIYAVLMGSVTGWFFYRASAGPKKDRLHASILWGVIAAILSVHAAFGGW